MPLRHVDMLPRFAGRGACKQQVKAHLSRRLASTKTLQELWAGGASVTDIAEESCERAARADRNEWISLVPREKVLERARLLQKEAASLSGDARRAQLPLLGSTFAVKDNIKVQGLPTTNAMDCRPPRQAAAAEQSAAVVQKLEEMGALVIGKTNMDCAATGLVGVRSPYGACQNAFDRSMISGGSSSGSGVSVALGQVTFSLGTDTAGSGRVPAHLNNIVGLKASRGLVSTHGLLPACKSLDCISVFALTVREAHEIMGLAAAASGADAWDRPASALTLGPRLQASGPASFTFAVPSKAFLDFSSFDADAAQARSYEEAWERSVEAVKAIGGKCVEVDYAPFQEAAAMLYKGPWVAERLSAVSDMLKSDPDAVDKTVKQICEQGHQYTAQQCFEAMYHMKELERASQQAMAAAGAQVLVIPTAGATYKIEDVLANPITLNTHMGRYTNHMNLLDRCGIAVPVTFAAENLPFGITIAGAAGHDAFICDIAQRLHMASGLQAGATSSSVADVSAACEASRGDFFGPLPSDVDSFQVAVCGLHMAGLPLTWQLTERGGRFLRCARTAPRYRLLAFDGMKPPRPGLVDSENGASIDLEIWELPAASFGSFMRLVASPLGIGWIDLEDGTRVQGFRQVDVGANHTGAVGAGQPPRDITALGSWRTYIKEKS